MSIQRRPLLLCVAFVLTACASACSSEPERPKVPEGAKSSGGKHAVIETAQGAISLEFFADESPIAVENFRLLAEHGYYDGLTFHRIVKGFMLQGGDPLGNGQGGESAWGGTFADNIVEDSPLYRTGYRRGVLAMANRGPNTNGSQFFIMHQDYPLPPNYVIFARVTGSMAAVDAIADVQTTAGQGGEMSAPVTPVMIKKITIQP